ncbi:GTA-gp10 family protein [Lichenihabitans psoromatis]|uniref:GTA-gp10 family protein n=1 Tax=Lichenihabitans psoromatis TaxID=2528642 RepID=UPI0010385585|nr:GTA-gp10 family protein [Lichenihabitans psoromatis]
MGERQYGVEAIFAGDPVRFALRPDQASVESLEAAIGSPFAAFTRFRDGVWTISDIRMVLGHAFPDAVLMQGLTRVATVDAAIVARPAATYAPLAIKILEAFLFGLAADQARFVEGPAL